MWKRNQDRKVRAGAVALAVLAGGIVASEPAAQAQGPFGVPGGPGFGVAEHSWPFWGGNLQNTHAGAGEIAINTGNVGTLREKWVFQTAGDIFATPTVEAGSVYVPDGGGYLYRIDAGTGKAIWSHKVSEYTGNAKSFSKNSPAIGPEQLIFGDQAGGTLMAVSKSTGALLWKTTVDSTEGAAITTSAVIVGNRVYVGVSSLQELLATVPGFQLSFRGSVAALDLGTGKILWQTYTVPTGYTGGAVWGSNFIVDEQRGSLFVTSGNNYSVPAPVAACITGAGASVSAKLACLDPEDYLDSMLALDLGTGKIKWGRRLEGSDTWVATCVVSGTGGVPCPDPSGPDYDFGSGPNFIRTVVNGKFVDAIGAGQKSGVYWALNPDSGAVLWGTQVGPGGDLGGMEFGSATDGKRVYVGLNDTDHAPYKLQPGNTQSWSAGSWAALDPATGAILWQVPVTGMNPLNPAQAAGTEAQVSVANGVVYAGSQSGDMDALDASSGKLLWKFASGGTVVCGPSIVDGTLYWGSGYSTFGAGTDNNKLYAFSLPAGTGGWSR